MPMMRMRSTTRDLGGAAGVCVCVCTVCVCMALCIHTMLMMCMRSRWKEHGWDEWGGGLIGQRVCVFVTVWLCVCVCPHTSVYACKPVLP